MDPWQLENIRVNLPDLLNMTTISPIFLALLKSSNTLSDAEVDQIKCAKPKLEKVSRLYDTVQRKTDGYWNMLVALQKSNQSGTVKIFLKGIPEDLIRNLKVLFLGKECRILELLPENEIKTVISQLQTSLSTEEYGTLCRNDLNIVDPIELVRLEIPKLKHLYIPRFLNRCIEVNPAVFHAAGRDQFVLKDFHNLDLNSIFKSSEDVLILHSTKQLFEKQINAKLILLDHEDDWEELKQRSRGPIHLIQFRKDENEFVLLETSGGSSVLHEYLVKSKTDSQARVLESEVLLKSFNSSRGLCVCDSPGMGKTMLLASLAQNARELYPNRIVVFLKLSDLVQTLKNQEKHTCMETIIQHITPSKTAFILLTSILQTNSANVELFFDALDEVQEEDQNTVKEFLTRLLDENKNIKLYLTARRHVREKLEQTLSVIAWDIEPLARESQIQFLVSFWQAQCHVSLKDKLCVFANMCITRLENRLDNRERIMTGIPLQCRLLAEVYADDARLFSHPKRNIREDPSITFTSLPEMYKNLIELRLGKSKCGLKCIHKKSGLYQPCDQQCEVINTHIAIAFEKILPEFYKSNFFHAQNLGTIDNGLILRVGLLENCGMICIEKCEFVHLTLAEYLVALYLAITINTGLPHKTKHPSLTKALQLVFHRLLYRKLLEYEKHEIDMEYGDDYIPKFAMINMEKEVIVYFLNYMLQTSLIVDSVSNLYSFVGYTSPRRLYNAILITLQYNLLNIFALIRLYMSNCGAFNRFVYKLFLNRNLDDVTRFTNVLCMACCRENLCAYKAVAKLLENIMRTEPIEMLAYTQEKENWQRLLRFVAIYCDCDFVEYLFHRVPNIMKEDFVLECIHFTQNRNTIYLQRRIKLVTFFDCKCEKIPKMIFSRLCFVHLEIVIHLLKLADSVTENIVWETVFCCAEYMNENDFLKLCDFVFKEYKTVTVININDSYEEKLKPWSNGHRLETINRVKDNLDKIFKLHL